MVTQRCLIGLDLGTSAIKGVLMAETGELLAQGKAPVQLDRPQPGYVEFDAEQFYHTVAGAIRRLVQALPPGGQVCGLAMASANGNTVLADSAGRPLHPAISWMDTRDRGEVNAVFGPLDAAVVHETAGWPLENMLPIAHLAWLRVHRPGLLDAAAHVAMSTEFIHYRLTGRWATDPSTATPSELLDQRHGRWHRGWLDALGIDESRLPAIVSGGSVLGAITAGAAVETGLAAGTPVLAGSFDHPSAARASGVLRQGQMLLSCGTSWVGFFPMEDRGAILRLGLLADPFQQPHGPWGAMASLAAVSERIDGIIATHLADGPDRFAACDRLAAQALPGAGGLMIDPVGDGPLPDLSRHSKADIARALMEGTAKHVLAWVKDLAGQGIGIEEAVMAGGPSESTMWPQVVSDVLGIPVHTMQGAHAGAVGAAILAGVGTGIFNDGDDGFLKTKQTGITYRPQAVKKATGLF